MKKYFYCRIKIKINITYIEITVKCEGKMEEKESSDFERWLNENLIIYNIKEWYYIGGTTKKEYQNSKLKFDLTI